MAYGVVNGAVGTLTSGNMHYRYAHHGGCRRCGEHFISVAQYHHHIRPDGFERIGHAGDAQSHGAGCVGRRISRHFHRHGGAYVKSGSGDFIHRVAVAVHKVHVGGHDMQLHSRSVLQLAGNT